MIGKLARQLVHRAAKTFYEGPEPPKRLRAMIEDFAVNNPHAVRAEWIEFCVNFAEECYRVGYMRGFEWRERQPEVANDVDAMNQEQESYQWEWTGPGEVPFLNSEVIVGVPEEQYREIHGAFEDEQRTVGIVPVQLARKDSGAPRKLWRRIARLFTRRKGDGDPSGN